MTTPTRRPIKLRNFLGHAKDFVKHHGDEIDLGVSYLFEELSAAGWPDRTPEDDRKPRRSIVKRCKLCKTGFTTADGAKVHTEETGHAEFVEPDPELAGQCDYNDPTGEMGLRLNRLHGDREALEDHRQVIETSLRAIELIARRYRPPATAAAPACSVMSCDTPAESYRLDGGSLGYRGMKLIAGIWIANPGTMPLCARHRKQRERAAS